MVLTSDTNYDKLEEQDLKEEEVYLIRYCRALKHGRVKVIVRDGVPQKIIRSEKDILIK